MTTTASSTRIGVGGNGGPAHEPPRKRRRRTRVIVIVGALAAVVVAAVAVVSRGDSSNSATADSAAATTTAVLTRQNLAQTESVSGTLAYAPTRPIVNQNSGTLTSRSADGTVVQRGDALYSVDAKPLILLIGTTPAYRDMSTSSSDGIDIQELKQNLSALGYSGLSDDGHFDSATKAAVANFETAKDLDGDGIVQLGEVLFAPGPVRISGAAVDVGSTVQPGSTVLDATATTKVVTAPFTATQASTAPVGTTVSISLPDGSTARGKITDISATASNANSSANSANGGGNAQNGGNNNTATQNTYTATATVSNTGIVARVDSSTVSVVIVDQQKSNVLAAPVTALVALAEGGYAVQVVDSSPQGSHLVAVKTGMFTDTLVEVSGTGIDAGTKVVVPQ